MLRLFDSGNYCISVVGPFVAFSLGKSRGESARLSELEASAEPALTNLCGLTGILPTCIANNREADCKACLKLNFQSSRDCTSNPVCETLANGFCNFNSGLC